MADKIVVMRDGVVEQIGSPWSSTIIRPTSSSPASSVRRQ